MVGCWAFKSFVNGGAYREALPILDKLLSNKPQEPEWNYYKAFCSHCLGENLQEAIKHYNIALDSGFDEFWVRYNRGTLFRQLGDMDKAFVDLRRAVDVDSTHEVAHKILADVAEMLSKPKPTYLVPMEELNKTRELMNKNEYQQASLRLEDLLKAYADNAELNYRYAFSLHMQKKDLRRALQYYNLALAYGFDEFWVKYNRGSLLEQLGDLEGAMTDIKRVLELKPGDFGATSILKQIQSKSKPKC